MLRPNEIIGKFKMDYEKSPQLATDNYYKISIVSNYIRKTRTLIKMLYGSLKLNTAHLI